MPEIKTVIVIHPMAIGDVVLGTPVPAAIKRAYPAARIIYFTHSSLLPLLQLCHSIDEYLEWQRKAPLLTQVAMVKRLRPDLLVDLTASLRTRLICALSGAKYVRYRKQRRKERPVIHVTDRYLSILSSLDSLDGFDESVPGTAPEPQIFPTLTISDELAERIKGIVGETFNRVTDQGPLIALIPGVGNLRPNRAWPAEHWIELVRNLQKRQLGQLVLVGGPDDRNLADKIEQSCESDNAYLNLASRLSLPETAALLRMADLVVSGDTGPCHIAVGVGTPVIGIMGPTLPERSGPYGYRAIGFDACSSCQCLEAKRCLLSTDIAAGICMNSIAPAAVLERIETLLSTIKRKY